MFKNMLKTSELVDGVFFFLNHSIAVNTLGTAMVGRGIVMP